jgi:hypothetical protein
MNPFRSDKLRDFAQECPKCMHCGKANEGDVVLAHSNRYEDGKGTGQKSSDCPAYICFTCHNIIDGRDRTGGLDAYTRHNLLLQASYKSTVWLLSTGRLVIGKPPYGD